MAAATMVRKRRTATGTGWCLLCLFTGLAGLTGCASSGDSATGRSALVADGPPTNCITTQQIRAMRVIDDRTIDFEMTGRRVFRNELPFRCSGLSFNTSIRHNSRTSQLCSFNAITPASLGSARSGPSCQLGQFQPMQRVPAPTTPPAP
jgi:hypothetical protein